MKINGFGMSRAQETLQKDQDKQTKEKNSTIKPQGKADTYSISPEAKAKMEEVAKQQQNVVEKPEGHHPSQPEHQKPPHSSGLIAGHPDYQLRLDNDPVIMPSFPDEESTRPTPEQSQEYKLIHLDPKEIQRMLASDPLPTMPLLGSEEQHGDATTFPSLAEEEIFPVGKLEEELERSEEEAKLKENLKNTMAELYASGNTQMMMAFLEQGGEDAMREVLGDELFDQYFEKISGADNTADKIREILSGTARTNTLLETLFPSK